MKHLVLSNYRCGTTWFCKHLAEKHSANNFDEILHNNYTVSEKLKGCALYLESKKPVVAKIFPTHIDAIENTNISKLYGKLINSSKLYYIKRRDIKAQIDSYIKALHLGFTQKIDWHTEVLEEQVITISRSEYEQYANFIISMNEKVKRLANTPGLDVEQIIFEDFATPEERYKRKIVLEVSG